MRTPVQSRVIWVRKRRQRERTQNKGVAANHRVDAETPVTEGTRRVAFPRKEKPMHLSHAIGGLLKKTARACALVAAGTVGLLVSGSLDTAEARRGFGNSASMSGGYKATGSAGKATMPGGNRAQMSGRVKASPNTAARKYPPGTKIRDHRKCKTNFYGGPCRAPRPGR
jgi:hypothetical protein